MICSSEYNVNAYPELYSIIRMPVPFDQLQVGNVYTRVYVQPNGVMTTISYTGILTGIRPRSDMNTHGPYAIFGNTESSHLDWVFFTPGDPAIPGGGHVEQTNLDISKAPNLGEITVNLGGEVNAISQEEFKDGDECVRIPTSGGGIQMNGRGYSIFKISMLQQWFNTGSHTNPLTRENIQQQDLEIFIYKSPVGGRRIKARKTKARAKKTKARKTKAKKTKAKTKSKA